MVFESNEKQFLQEQMCINASEFSNDLVKMFGINSAIDMNDIVAFLIQDKAAIEFGSASIEQYPLVKDSFWQRFSCNLSQLGYNEGEFFDYCYELFNYFCAFHSGGLEALFKSRAPEWHGPRIYLKERICDDCQLSKLPKKITAYRGMSVEEYRGNSFGMSWSLDIEQAQRFASIQEGCGVKSVIVKAEIDRVDVLYHNPSDPEQEIVVVNGTITSGNIVKCNITNC